jgi:hypothetical protein
MTKTLKIIFIFILLPSSVFAAKTCSIFIHGYTPTSESYFGELPRQVHWDSSKNIEVASLEVAKGILEKMDTCEDGDLITLRPHSYGAAQVFYILGLGKRFQAKYPNHDFVKVYKKTFEVFSFTGAYHGTALMNLVCSNFLTKTIGDRFGKSCVESLLTSTLSGATDYVNSPGVPTYLIHSTNRSGYLGTTGGIIAKFGVSFWDYYIKGVRDQNDNTLPISATRGCANQETMKNENDNCKKIDSNFLIDFFHEKESNHTEFLDDADFMYMGSIDEK